MYIQNGGHIDVFLSLHVLTLGLLKRLSHYLWTLMVKIFKQDLIIYLDLQRIWSQWYPLFHNEVVCRGTVNTIGSNDEMTSCTSQFYLFDQECDLFCSNDCGFFYKLNIEFDTHILHRNSFKSLLWLDKNQFFQFRSTIADHICPGKAI